MARFVVDAASLLSLRATLGELHDELPGAGTELAAYAGVLGGGDLEAELERFARDWEFGIASLASDLAGLLQRLLTAAAAYAAIEENVSATGSGAAGLVAGIAGGTA
jgi:hypothetical protein